MGLWREETAHVCSFGCMCVCRQAASPVNTGIVSFPSDCIVRILCFLPLSGNHAHSALFSASSTAPAASRRLESSQRFFFLITQNARIFCLRFYLFLLKRQICRETDLPQRLQSKDLTTRPLHWACKRYFHCRPGLL